MPVSVASSVSGPFVPNGATTDFPFTFKVISADEVAVVDQDGGVLSSALYTVDLDDDEGGTVSFTVAPELADYDALYVISEPAFTQSYDFSNAGPSFNPASLTRAIDHSAVRAIYLKSRVDRALLAPFGESLGDLPAEADRASMFLAFDADGNPTASSGTGADAGLRTDLAASSGAALVDHKRGEATTYARSVADLANVGALGDAHSVMHWINPIHDAAIIAGTISVDLRGYIQNALDALAAKPGRKVLAFPAGLAFRIESSLEVQGDDIIVDARGAIVSSPDTALVYMIHLQGDRCEIRGGTWRSTVDDNTYAVNVTGEDCKLLDARFEKTGAAPVNKVFIYVRHTADGFQMRGCTSEDFGGIFNEASRAQYIGNRIIFQPNHTDDGIAIKGANDSCRDVQIIGNYLEGATYIVSIGSEIGVLGANDPTYSRVVSGVQIIGNIGKDVAGILYIKPGANEPQDYRDGTVEDIIVSDNFVEDQTGLRFLNGVFISPARGARVRNIKGKGNIVHARSSSDGAAVQTVGGLFCYNIDYSVQSPGSLEPSIDDINVGLTFIDPYEGQSNDVSRPGYPVQSIAKFENDTTAFGSMSNIILEGLVGNGSSNAGLLVLAGLDDAVTVRDVDLRNVNRSAAAEGGAYLFSRVIWENAKIAHGVGIPIRYGAGGAIDSRTVKETFHHAQINAGNPDTQRPLTAPRRALLVKLELLSTQNVVQSDTDYMTLTLRNMSGSGDPFHLPNTKATGGTEAQPNFGLTAFEWETIFDAATITDSTNVAQMFFAKDGQLQVAKTDTGAGAALVNSRLRAHWAPY